MRINRGRVAKIAAQVAVLSGVAASVSLVASAQLSPPGGPLGTRTLAIQKAPTLLKFQAQITQAKLPVGDVTFSQILVNLRAGDTQLCTEKIPNVVVREGVLNLEIGRDTSCPLDDFIAKQTDLNFQVCLNSAENCLKPVALSSVPFAIKSTYAQTTERAMHADAAGVASYAQRVTAERNPFTPDGLGKGYYDFATPASAASLSKASDDAGYVAGGYMLWTPTEVSKPMVNIAGKGVNTDAPMILDGILLHTKELRVRGSEAIETGLDVAGASQLHGLTSTGDLTCGGAARVVGASFDYENATGRFGVAASKVTLSTSTELRVAGTGTMIVDTPVQFTKDVAFAAPPNFIVANNSVDETKLTATVRTKLGAIDGVQQQVNDLNDTVQSEIFDVQTGTTYLPEWILGDPPVPGNNTVTRNWAPTEPKAGGVCVKITSTGFKATACTEQLPFVCGRRATGTVERGPWIRGYRACRASGGFVLPEDNAAATALGWNGQDAWVAGTNTEGNGVFYRPQAMRAWALKRTGRF